MTQGTAPPKAETAPVPDAKSAGRAAAALAWLDGHPSVKLTLIAIIPLATLVVTGLAFIDDHVLERRREEAREQKADREKGLHETPPTELQYDGNVCRFMNVGSFPLLLPRLRLEGHVVDLTDGKVRMGRSRDVEQPDVRADGVGPNETLTVDVSASWGGSSSFDGDRCSLLRNARTDLENCGWKDHDCVAVLECNALFERATDHALFQQTQHVLIEPGCEVVQEWSPAARTERFRRAVGIADAAGENFDALLAKQHEMPRANVTRIR